jgi:hypothetical protein
MAINLLARKMFNQDCPCVGSVDGEFGPFPESAGRDDYRKMSHAVMAFRRLAWDGKIRSAFVDRNADIPAHHWGGSLGEILTSTVSGAGLVWKNDILRGIIVPGGDLRRIFESYSSSDLRRLGDIVGDVLLRADREVLTPLLASDQHQSDAQERGVTEQASSSLSARPSMQNEPTPLANKDSIYRIYRSGGAGRPTSMHLVRSELHRLTSEGKVWRSKIEAAEELASWLLRAHPEAPRLTSKAILNSLRPMIPTARN